MKKFLAEFKAFALRGNVLDLAVGVIIGTAFTAIVTALTDNFIQPLLNKVMTGTAGEGWTIGGAFSAFLTVVVNFIITALVLFLLIKAINKLMSIGKKPTAPAEPTTKECPYCMSQIAIKATRCPNCTSQLDDAKAIATGKK